MTLSNIVDVQITRQTTTVSQAGFGTLLIAGPNATFVERLRYYSNIDGVAEDFATTDAEYKMASAAFSQELSPSRIAIGKMLASVAAVYTIDLNQNAVAGDALSVDVNGTTYSASGSAAYNDLTVAINALDNISAVASGTPDWTITITGTAGISLVVENLVVTDGGSGITGTLVNTTPQVLPDSELTAIEAYESDWYALATVSKDKVEQELISAWIEARRKLYIARTDDANVLDPLSTDDIAYNTKNLSYDRTAVIYHADAATEYPDAAWFGRVLPLNPGSATWAFKTLSGVGANSLSTSEETAVFGKNGNNYQLIGGVNITRQGTVASGEYLDVIRGVDWLEARIQERIYSKLVNLDKIPFTDAGIAIIENEIRAQLASGIGVGLLSNDPAPSVSVPFAADVSAADKGNRLLPDVTFAATLAGAVHKVQVRGTVSL